MVKFSHLYFQTNCPFILLLYRFDIIYSSMIKFMSNLINTLSVPPEVHIFKTYFYSNKSKNILNINVPIFGGGKYITWWLNIKEKINLWKCEVYSQEFGYSYNLNTFDEYIRTPSLINCLCEWWIWCAFLAKQKE